ncbi:MAG: flagellar hook-basal body complex protein FliE [Balneolales bacterium]|nr:flagellar hook-basal body complex protein FliE [Balneolales bacterium]
MELGNITGIGLPQDVEQDQRFFDINVDGIDNSFGDMLSEAIQGVDTNIKASEASIQNFVSGKSDNIADVMVSMQKAQLSFQMMVEVRNKVIETYQEISRMQV